MMNNSTTIADQYPDVVNNIAFIGMEPAWYWKWIYTSRQQRTNDRKWLAQCLWVSMLAWPEIADMSTVLDVQAALHEVLTSEPSAIILWWSVYNISKQDSSLYPFLDPNGVRAFVRQAIFDHNIPILGICWWHQLLAWSLSNDLDQESVVCPRSKPNIWVASNSIFATDDPLFVWQQGDYYSIQTQSYTVSPLILQPNNLLPWFTAILLAKDNTYEEWIQALRYTLSESAIPIYGIQANIPIPSNAFRDYLRWKRERMITTWILDNKSYIQKVNAVSSFDSAISAFHYLLLKNFCSMVDDYRNKTR